MPSKSKTPKEATKQEAPKPNLIQRISTADFNIKKLSLEPITETADQMKESPQFNAYVRYDYGTDGKKKVDDNGKPENTNNRCVVVTLPIEIKKGGIPRLDQWRLTDNDCMNFFLNLDQDEGGKDLRDKVFGPLDTLCQKKINKDGNKDFFTKVSDKGVPVAITKLKFKSGVKMSGSGDDDDAPTNGKAKPVPYERIKVKLPTVFKKDADKNAPKEIKIQAFYQGAEVEIKTLQDLRDAFPWGCKAEFVLEINKFWAMRTLKDGERDCGYGVKCLAINVIEKPKATSAAVINSSIFGIGKSAKAESGSESESDDESKSEEGSKSGSESESENDKDKKDDDKSESGSDSGSESESEDEKPASKKGAGKKADIKKKPASDDDSESDNEAPAPKKGTKPVAAPTKPKKTKV